MRPFGNNKEKNNIIIKETKIMTTPTHPPKHLNFTPKYTKSKKGGTRSCLAQDKARNITVSSFCNACVSFHYLFTFVQTVYVSKKPKLI